VVSRAELLDVVAADNLELGERNIDFLVSRLRRKLGDSPKSPRFIATQYGEGYVWIAARQPQPETGRAPALLRVGPVQGADGALDDASAFFRKLSALRDLLASELERDDEVVVSMDPDTKAPTHPCEYALEPSFLHRRRSTLCSFVLRDGRTDRIYATWRLPLPPEGMELGAEFAGQVVSELRKAAIYRTSDSALPGEPPLAVALDRAADLFLPSAGRYREITRMLRERLSLDPQDHHAAILLAANLHVAMVRGDLDGFGERIREMEGLVLTHLPAVQDDALYLSAAAKLLYFVGHRELAAQLAETAFDLGPAFAATLMVLGQVRMFEGDLADAAECYDQALERSADGSRFQSMILLLKASLLRVSGDMNPVGDLVKRVVELDPGRRLVMNAYLLGDDARCDPEVGALAAGIGVEQWRRLLVHLHSINARLFVRAVHRERMLAGLARLAVKHVGPDCLAGELWSSVPALCRALTEGASADRK
jgi:hypothetical protein